MQEDQRLAVLGDFQMHVGDPSESLRQRGQLEVMGGEQGEGADAGGQVLGAGARQRQAVVGAGAAADLIHQHQAAGGGVVEDVGGFGHFHHEGGASRGQLVGGADAGENAVHRADASHLRRYVAAHVGEQHDQRHLAHVGGFAAHVGAGDDQQAPVHVQAQVVGHEGSVQGLFHHRMAPGLDLQYRFRNQFRLAPVQAQGPFGQAQQAVQRGDRGNRVLQAIQLARQLAEQGVIKQLFAHQGPFARAQHLILEAFQFFGDVALGALEGLAPGVFGGHAFGMAAAQLDVVAVHAVVADLEGGDAGALPFAPFQIQQEAVGVFRQGAQPVEFRIETGCDHAAFAQQRRRLVRQRPLQALAHRRMVGQIVHQAIQQRAVQIKQQSAQLGQARQPPAQGGQVPWPGGGQRDAGQDALQVAHAAQQALQGLARRGVAQGGDGLVTATQFALLAQRALHPAPQQAAAHRCLGAVQHGGQGVFGAAAQIGFQLQVAAGRGIEQQTVLGMLHMQRTQMRQGATLGVLHIRQQRARSGDSGIEPFGAEAAQVMGLELAAQLLLRAEHIEMPGRAPPQGAMGGPWRGQGKVFGNQQFRGLQPLQFRQPVGLVDRFQDAEAAAGQIQPRQGVAFADPVQTGQQIVAMGLQQAVFSDRAGRDDAGDGALHRTLAGCGGAHLFADHCRLAQLEQAGQIALQGVVGDAGHGDRRTGRFTALGQSQVQ